MGAARRSSESAAKENKRSHDLKEVTVMSRWITLLLTLAILELVAPGRGQAQAASKYVVVYGVPLECTAAASFRDGDLLRQFVALEGRWKDGTVDRYDNLINQYEARHVMVAAKWGQASAAAKKQLLKELVMLAVSLAGERLGKAAVGQAAASGADATEQAAIKEVTELLVAHTSLVAESTLGQGPEMKDYFLDLPAASRVLIAAVSPPVSITIGASKKASDIADVVFAAWDWWLTEKFASQNLSILEQGMKDLIAKSPLSRLRQLNEIKNVIDKDCG